MAVEIKFSQVFVSVANEKDRVQSLRAGGGGLGILTPLAGLSKLETGWPAINSSHGSSHECMRCLTTPCYTL